MASPLSPVSVLEYAPICDWGCGVGSGGRRLDHCAHLRPQRIYRAIAVDRHQRLAVLVEREDACGERVVADGAPALEFVAFEHRHVRLVHGWGDQRVAVVDLLVRVQFRGFLSFRSGTAVEVELDGPLV